MSRTRGAAKGFTLVELLVVVLILAILMAVALPLYLGAIKNSERATARANMQTISNANQAHRLKIGSYTTQLSDLSDDLGGDATHVITGPGQRDYNIQLNTTTSPVPCAATSDPANIPQIPVGGFGVYTTGASADAAQDGCFVPGVSTN